VLPVGLYLPVPHSAQSLCRCPGLECESPTDRLTARAVRTAHHGTSGPRCARTPRTALPNTLPPGRRWEGGGQSEAPLGVIADRGVGRRARLGGAADGRSGTRRYSRARGLLERRDRDVSIRAGRSVDGLPLGSGPSVLRVRLHARRMLSGMPFWSHYTRGPAGGLLPRPDRRAGSHWCAFCGPRRTLAVLFSTSNDARSRNPRNAGPSAFSWACRGAWVPYLGAVRRRPRRYTVALPPPRVNTGKTCVDPEGPPGLDAPL